MKYIKEFENLNYKEPNVGDYVICQEKNENKDFISFIENNIGQIIKIKQYYTNEKLYYYIRYTGIPDNIKYHFYEGIHIDLYENNIRGMFLSEIKYWSKDKEDLETILSTNKYNL